MVTDACIQFLAPIRYSSSRIKTDLEKRELAKIPERESKGREGEAWAQGHEAAPVLSIGRRAGEKARL